VAMIPHEKTLVERLEDEPFTLLGVNSDPEGTYREKRAEMGVTWPSFHDGGSTGGPIASAWNVRGWPTIYVLDHTGTIRYKGVRGEAMDDAVDTLLAEMKGEDAPGRSDGPVDDAEPDAGSGGTRPALPIIPAGRAKKGETRPAAPIIPAGRGTKSGG